MFAFTCSGTGLMIATNADGDQYPVCTDGTGAWVQYTSFADTQVDPASFSDLMAVVFLTLAIAYCIRLLVRTFRGNRR